MDIIKLDAIDSTSLFLKDLSKNGKIENFTTVVADEQYEGKGQMNTHWHSAKGKNLLFTIYARLDGMSIDFLPFVNFLVATQLQEVLTQYLGEKSKIRIKWPNDIMSYNQKIAGVLVENTLKGGKVGKTFIGIGLNVNQIIFPDYLTNTTSMKIISGKVFDKTTILEAVLKLLKKVLTTDYIKNNQEEIKEAYLGFLYKKGLPTMFQDKAGDVFMGKVITVSDSGLLKVEKEDDTVHTYAVKEIKFL